MCRGFHVCYIREDTAIPEKVDLKTGNIRYALRPCHKFRISFDARGPRDEMKVCCAQLDVARLELGPAVALAAWHFRKFPSYFACLQMHGHDLADVHV